MNRVDRLLALIVFLQSRRVVTADQLAEHFELSVRTIYRDLAALGEAGVPIVAEAGVGYTLMRGYHLPPVNFTTDEASALVTGGLLVEQFADDSVKSQMHSALRKVRAVLPREHQDRVERLERAMGTTANADAPIQADLTTLQQAIAERRLMNFSYRGARRSDSPERVVEPYGLLHYLNRWHLIAWCRSVESYRDFRTDRMSAVTMPGGTFEPRQDFSLARYIRSMPTPKLRARVHFTALAADRAKREWWMGIHAEDPVLDGIVLTLSAVDWKSLTHWLLSFETQATVLEPATLRESLVEAAKNAAAHHGRKPRIDR